MHTLFYSQYPQKWSLKQKRILVNLREAKIRENYRNENAEGFNPKLWMHLMNVPILVSNVRVLLIQMRLSYDRFTTLHVPTKMHYLWTKSKKENSQELTQFSSRSHPRHLVGKWTAQKDTIIDITSDSQVNSKIRYRWSPASLTFNNYFTYFYIYI